MKLPLDMKHPRSWDLRLPRALAKRNPPFSPPSSHFVAAIRAVVSPSAVFGSSNPPTMIASCIERGLIPDIQFDFLEREHD
jgi:hypothetical protein